MRSADETERMRSPLLSIIADLKRALVEIILVYLVVDFANGHDGDRRAKGCLGGVPLSIVLIGGRGTSAWPRQTGWSLTVKGRFGPGKVGSNLEPSERSGAAPILAGLHHQYVRT